MYILYNYISTDKIIYNESILHQKMLIYFWNWISVRTLLIQILGYHICKPLSQVKQHLGCQFKNNSSVPFILKK